MDSSQIKQLLKPENSSPLVQTEWCNIPSWYGVIIKHAFTLCSHFLCSNSKLLLLSPTNCQLFTKKYWGLADATIYQKENCIPASVSLKTEFWTWGRTACAPEVLLRLRHFLVPRQFYPPLLNPGAVRECCLIRVAKFHHFWVSSWLFYDNLEHFFAQFVKHQFYLNPGAVGECCFCKNWQVWASSQHFPFPLHNL